MKDCRGRALLETTPGDSVDQDFVMEAALELCQDYDVTRGGFDPWNARKLYQDMLKAGMDEDIWLEMRQGIQTLGEGSRHFERLVFAGLYGHGANPVLRWMAQNVVIRFDENMNFMPAKKRSAEKVDGIVCGVMGTTLLFADGDDDVIGDDYELKVIGG
jgi:phage terminase large subunit-like protein